MAIEISPTFGLVHGAWHGAWCWDFLRAELSAKGYQSIAMDLPIDDPNKNFDDYAEVVADSLAGAEPAVLVGHSRAGNVLPRVANKMAVSKLIYLCSSFEPATIGHPTDSELDHTPPRNPPEFSTGIILLEDNLTIYNSDLAKRVLFSDCPPEVQEWATRHLRPQRRSVPETTVRTWPNTPQEYVLCQDDRVINPEWSRYAARNWLDIEPIEFPGGHAPFLSRPLELANLLISLAYQQP